MSDRYSIAALITSLKPSELCAALRHNFRALVTAGGGYCWAQDTPDQTIGFDSARVWFGQSRVDWAGDATVDLSTGTYQVSALSVNYYNKLLFTLDKDGDLNMAEGTEAATEEGVVEPALPEGEYPMAMVTVQDNGTGGAGTIENVEQDDIVQMQGSVLALNDLTLAGDLAAVNAALSGALNVAGNVTFTGSQRAVSIESDPTTFVGYYQLKDTGSGNYWRMLMRGTDHGSLANDFELDYSGTTWLRADVSDSKLIVHSSLALYVAGILNVAGVVTFDGWLTVGDAIGEGITIGPASGGTNNTNLQLIALHDDYSAIRVRSASTEMANIIMTGSAGGIDLQLKGNLTITDLDDAYATRFTLDSSNGQIAIATSLVQVNGPAGADAEFVVNAPAGYDGSLKFRLAAAYVAKVSWDSSDSNLRFDTTGGFYFHGGGIKAPQLGGANPSGLKAAYYNTSTGELTYDNT